MPTYEEQISSPIRAEIFFPYSPGFWISLPLAKPTGLGMAELPTDRTFWEKLLSRVRRRTHGGSDAEDLLQSAYIRLAKYRAQHVVTNPAAFLVHAAVNIGIDGHRHQRLLNPCDLAEAHGLADNMPLQDEAMAARARLTRVREGLFKLPQRTREIFLMHRIEGLKYREIARREGISQSAVEKHIAKATLFLTDWTQGW